MAGRFATGTAVSAPGNPDRRHLAWIDRQGQITQIPGEPEQITHASLSRDGRRVLYNGRDAQWVRDLVTGTKTRVLSDVRSMSGGWLPGDERIVVSANKTGDWDLYTIRASGGDLRPLLTRPRTQHPLAVAPDGSIVLVDNSVTTDRHRDPGAGWSCRRWSSRHFTRRRPTLARQPPRRVCVRRVDATMSMPCPFPPGRA